MAGFESRNDGRNPGDISRRNKLHAAARARAEARKKPVKPTTVKPTTVKSTTAERVTAEGRQANARAQRLGSYTAPIVKPTTARFGVGGDKTVMHNGRSMANVTADQLKETGLALPQYMRLWGKTGKRPAVLERERAARVKVVEDAEGNPATRRGRDPSSKAVKDAEESEKIRMWKEEQEAALQRAVAVEEKILERDARVKAVKDAERNPATRRGRDPSSKPPYGGLYKGGLVKKSAAKNIDGIATKGKTRANHR
jgi:hypothetical protein